MKVSDPTFSKLFDMTLQSAEGFTYLGKTLLDAKDNSDGEVVDLPFRRGPKFSPLASGADSPGVVTLGYDPESGEPVQGYGPGAMLSAGTGVEYPGDDSHERIDLGKLARLSAFGECPNSQVEQKLLAGGSMTSGGVMLPQHTSAWLVDLARAQTQVVRAGGYTVPITGDTKIAQVTADPTAAWKSEGAPITKSEPTFGAVNLRPKTLGVYGVMSEELAADAVNMGDAIAQVISGVLAVEIDRVCLRGSGAANEPQGALNATGIGTTGSVGALTSYAPISVGIADILGNNLEPSAAIYSPAMAGKLDLLSDSLGQPMSPSPMVASLPKLYSTSVPDGVSAATGECYIGDFRQLWIGLRQGIAIEFSKHASNDTQSAFRDFTIFFRAVARMDVAIVRPSGFHVLTGIDNS